MPALLTALLLLTAPPSTSHPAGRFAKTPREVLDLTGRWELAPVAGDQLGDPPPAGYAPYLLDPACPWRPYHWGAYNPAWKDVERVWCRLKLALPESFHGRRVSLRFAAVHTTSHLYVNGRHVLDNRDPFTPFEADLTDRLRPGENVAHLGIEHYTKDQPMTWPVGAMYRYQAGITGNVSLIAHADSTIDDVCLRTQLAGRKLTARVELGGRRLSGSVRVKVLDEAEQTVLTLPAQPVQPPVVELSAAWPDMQLWSPETPVLYTAVAELVDGEGQVVDARRARFGFREFTADGPALKLNGVKVRLKGIWGHSGEWIWGQPKEPAEIWRTLRAGNLNCARIHGQPLDPAFYDAADEVGYFLVDESGVFQRPRTPHSVEHLRRLVRRDRDHPSVVIWSTSNEFEHWVVPRAKGAVALLTEMYRAVKESDPTRPVMHHGFGPLPGTMDLVNLHYPESAGLWRGSRNFDWPDHGTLNRNYPFFRWDRTLPLAIGEHLIYHDQHYLSVAGPSWSAAETGSAAQYDIMADAFQFAMDRYRQLDVAHVAPMAFRSSPDGKTIPNPYFERIKTIFNPLGGYLSQPLASLASGPVTLQLTGYNETFHPQTLRLGAALTVDDATVRWTCEPIEIGPAETAPRELTLTVPTVAEPTEAGFVITTQVGEHLAAERRYPLWIFPATEPEPLTGPVALWDPDGTAGGLARLVKVQAVGNPSDAPAGGLLALAPGAADERLAPEATRLARSVAAGGRVLAFAQTSQARWLPLPLAPLLPGDAPETARAFAQPPLDVPDGWLRDWRPNELIAAGTYSLLDEPTVEPLLVSGGPGGLDRSPLLRILYGKGAYYLCQLDLDSPDPARPWVLRALLKLALQPLTDTAPVPPVTAYRVGHYRPIDLRRFCNVGWDNPEAFDVRALPTGQLESGGIPFEILEPATNDGKSCLVLTESRKSGADGTEVRSNGLDFPGASDIPVGGTIDELHLLLACRQSELYEGWSKDTLASLKINYQDGGTERFAIDYNRQVTDWLDEPRELPFGKVAWQGDAAGRTAVVYRTTWHNPNPTREVRSVTLWQSQAPSKTPGLLALTAREVEPLR